MKGKQNVLLKILSVHLAKLNVCLVLVWALYLRCLISVWRNGTVPLASIIYFFLYHFKLICNLLVLYKTNAFLHHCFPSVLKFFPKVFVTSILTSGIIAPFVLSVTKQTELHSFIHNTFHLVFNFLEELLPKALLKLADFTQSTVQLQSSREVLLYVGG